VYLTVGFLAEDLMTRWRGAVVMCAAAGLLASAAGSARAQAPAAAAAQKAAAPVKGVADVGSLVPKSKIEGNDVVTTIEIKNLSKGSIVGLEIAEFWWDKNNNPVQGTGDRQRLKKPLQPGELATVVLRSPRVPGMVRANYQFTHANGQVKMRVLQTLK
jgi:hypothetical protein